MKTLIHACLVSSVLLCSLPAMAEDVSYKPFVIASSGPGSLAEKTQSTLVALQDAGFELAGQYSPLDGTNVIVVTNDELKKIASMSERGGYAAGQRVAVSEAGDNIEVSYVNPVYIQYGYRLAGDMKPIADALSKGLGNQAVCGGGDKNMTAKKLEKYHYMMGMQRFDDPSVLGAFDSHESAVAAVEKGLAKEGDALTRVYRIDIPGKQQTVFGVGMKKTNADEEDIDSAFQMSIVDFEGCKKRAYFPYEILVNGNKVEALHMRFRMALHFPNLSMMGKHGFTKLMSAPRAIEDALKNVVNAK